MLGDAIAAKKSSDDTKNTLEVVDVAQLLARSVLRDRSGGRGVSLMRRGCHVHAVLPQRPFGLG
jgi:hypothetical protein